MENILGVNGHDRTIGFDQVGEMDAKDLSVTDTTRLTFTIGQTVWLIETQSKAVILNRWRVDKITRLLVRTENKTVMQLDERKASHAIPPPDPYVCRNVKKDSRRGSVRSSVRRVSKNK
jgi:hypothetical protein